MDRSTVILTSKDVDKLLSVEDCIAAVEEALGMWGRGEVPAPAILGVHVSGGGFHIKAASLSRARSYFAAKTNANFPPNPERFGLPSIQGVIVLFDAERGIPLAVIDSIRITELRTAAGTAVAISQLSRPESKSVTLIGCGAQGRSHVRALAVVRDLERIWVTDVDPAMAQHFAAEMAGELGIPVEVAADLRGAAVNSDIVVTCTPSRRPLIGPGDVGPGATVAAVGADSPEKQEMDPELLASAKLVVDSLDQCAEIGDLHHAIVAGRLKKEDVYAELAAVVAGLKPGRESDEEIIVFDSTGTALQDVACAALVYERAMESGLGVSVNFAD